MRYSIELGPDGKGGTTAVWAQLITALNDSGDEWLAKQENGIFEEKIKSLERMFNHYLDTGEMLKIT